MEPRQPHINHKTRRCCVMPNPQNRRAPGVPDERHQFPVSEHRMSSFSPVRIAACFGVFWFPVRLYTANAIDRTFGNATSTTSRVTSHENDRSSEQPDQNVKRESASSVLREKETRGQHQGQRDTNRKHNVGKLCGCSSLHQRFLPLVTPRRRNRRWRRRRSSRRRRRSQHCLGSIPHRHILVQSHNIEQSN